MENKIKWNFLYKLNQCTHAELSEELVSFCLCLRCHDDMSGCVCSYRCGSAGEPPGIPLSGTGHHTGHRRWPSHQLHNNRRQKRGGLVHINTHASHLEKRREKRHLKGDVETKYIQSIKIKNHSQVSTLNFPALFYTHPYHWNFQLS